MKLRKLEQKDAIHMYEWMQDREITRHMRTNFTNKTLKDCYKFIEASWKLENSIHLAIVDDDDKYMGTVSLKNISGKMAEFAITVRREAMGRGYSSYGMKEMLRIGFEEKGLEQIYWYVSPENIRALKFYDKGMYKRLDGTPIEIGGKINNFIWYQKTNKPEGKVNDESL